MSLDSGAEKIEDLKQQRSSTKGNISRIKNAVEGKSLSATELECRLGILESYFKQALSYQTQIERIAPADTGRSELEDVYISTKAKILSLLGNGRRTSAVETSFSIPHTHINHLPKLRLPRFNGKYSEYKNFINSFTTLVDNDPTLSKIEKFNHLLTCLTDQALGTVKAFQVTEDNYAKALDRLKERYDNDCLIFLEYISELFELPKVPKASGTQLRSLVDNISALFNSLLSLGTYENICNAIIIYMAMSKVDPETQSKWDEQLEYKDLPTWSKCADILSKRCQYLEARDSKLLKAETSQRHHFKSTNFHHRNQTSLTIAQRSCSFCRDSNHYISNCSTFSKLSVMDRFSNAKRLGLCLNCLGKGHSVSRCPSSQRCRNCRQAHHTLLHRPQQSENCSNDGRISPPVVVHTASKKEHSPDEGQVMLATALVLVKESSGGFQVGRVLLDSGSQVNLVNEKFAKLLNLKKQRKRISIVGVGIAETKIDYQTQTTIKSRFNNFELSLEFLITPSITGYQPETSLIVTDWNLPKNVVLADEQFNKSSQIDLLLGAEAFFDLLQVGQIKLGQGLPSLQKTSLGWIVSGRYKSPLGYTRQSCYLKTEDNALHEYVERLWKLEEVVGQKLKWSEEQRECEEHFKKHIKVEPSGKLMVQLPFKIDPACLGTSYDIAFKRFLSLERRLSKDQFLRAEYSKFLKEYISLGHMSLVKTPNLDKPHYYLPHQCVTKPNSVSTKLRVVFDASCCTSSQISLNGILMVGPTIQNELLITLLRFRLHRYAITADIVKMYRQILIHPSHRNFQYILWRESDQIPIQTYELNTVTYGTSSAPFLAIRCLQYLSEQNSDKYKLGSRVLQSDFYVDDMLTGADDLDTIRQIQREVVTILNSAGFELSKWHSNNPHVIGSAMATQPSKDIKLNESNLTSTLGITWDPFDDEFRFSYNPNQHFSKFTKRSILSLSSSLFDPMGLLSPIIIKAKIILQKLWVEKLDWDSSIPQSIDTEWRQFMSDLYSLKNLSVPRFALAENKQSYQIHGFSDASMNAYGCCLYARTIDISGRVSVKLLVARSRVAPAEKKQLPRLELCGAHLLSKLWKKIRKICQNLDVEVYFWTDATIVLHWISTHSSKLTTFVGNRVAEIQENTQGVFWRHVPTHENPADKVSRGCTISELKQSIWFQGPKFLLQKPESWPALVEIHLSSEELLLEKRKTALTCHQIKSNHVLEVIDKYSSYIKILRIFAYVLRAISRLKRQQVEKSLILTSIELENALLQIIYTIQINSFQVEFEALRRNRELKGSIKWLNPFVEESNGLSFLKVGGRLKHANIPEECKHPLLLPKNCSFTTVIVRHLHLTNYHAGPKVLVGLVRQRFWIVNVRDIARQVVRNCIHCVRYRPRLLEQVMGDLPAERVTPSRPFSRCGVDFCGPIYTYYKIRGNVPYKTYVSVFVCFASKAVHLEAVSDLSADAFVAALKRMIGRRGLPQHLYCDNATNFVGAQSKLVEFRNMFYKHSSQELIFNFCSERNINFHFIPPRAPHFGGLWESAVKTAKGHLYRSLGSSKLTFEELSTVLVEVEAVMNSRPLTPLSSDPNDVEALTPAHFLIGSSLKSIPEPAADVLDISSLQRWRRNNAVKAHFWKRWSKEYIQELQGRGKWTTLHPNLNIGNLVIVHEDNTPPQKWLMGRVTGVVQGQDGIVRVADVRTSKGSIRRPIRKLALLPS